MESDLRFGGQQGMYDPPGYDAGAQGYGDSGYRRAGGSWHGEEEDMSGQEMYGNRDGRLMELLSEYRPFEPVSGPAQGIEDKTVEELFLGFYRERRDGMEPDGPERALLRFAADQVRRMNRDEDKLEWERQSAALLKFALGQEDEE